MKSTRFWKFKLKVQCIQFQFFFSFPFFPELLKLKIFFCSFHFFANGRIHNVVSTMINAVKLEVKNNNLVSTLSKVVNINVEIDNVNSTLFNVVNFNVDKHNVVSTLIWRCLTSRRHTNLTTTLKQRWNVCWA